MIDWKITTNIIPAFCIFKYILNAFGVTNDSFHMSINNQLDKDLLNSRHNSVETENTHSFMNNVNIMSGSGPFDNSNFYKTPDILIQCDPH